MTENLFDQLLADSGKKHLPDAWQPKTIRESYIEIDEQGDWHHRGSKIRRPEMVRLFAGILRRENDAYYLVTPHEKQSVKVRDVPFQIVAVHRKASGPSQKLIMVTNTEDVVCIDAEHPLRMRPYRGSLAPYIRVRDELEARVSRAVYYQLADWLTAETEGSANSGVWSFGFFHRLMDEDQA